MSFPRFQDEGYSPHRRPVFLLFLETISILKAEALHFDLLILPCEFAAA